MIWKWCNHTKRAVKRNMLWSNANETIGMLRVFFFDILLSRSPECL